MIKKLMFGSEECLFDLPDICPWCDKGISPIPLANAKAAEGNEFGFIVACPVCKHLFLSLHTIQLGYMGDLHSERITSPPLQAPPSQIPSEINITIQTFIKSTIRHLSLRSVDWIKYAGWHIEKPLKYW